MGLLSPLLSSAAISENKRIDTQKGGSQYRLPVTGANTVQCKAFKAGCICPRIMPELDVSSLSVREEGSVHANEAPMYTVYTVLCPLSHGVLFCFLSEGLVANYAAQYVAAVSDVI